MVMLVVVMLLVVLVVLVSLVDAPGVSVKVEVGDDAILPCNLGAELSTKGLQVKWERNGEEVHLYRSGADYFRTQSKNFANRTSLLLFPHDEVVGGNASLKLTNVTDRDAGNYTCTVKATNLPPEGRTCYVSLEPVKKGNKGNLTYNRVIGSHEPVKAAVGDDATLPCRLEPPFDVRALTVEWKRNETNVHLFQSGGDYLIDQDENFKGRTSLFHEEMVRGNISLELTNVTEQDAGNYSCHVPELDRRGYVTLSVGGTPVWVWIVVALVVALVVVFVVVSVAVIFGVIGSRKYKEQPNNGDEREMDQLNREQGNGDPNNEAEDSV